MKAPAASRRSRRSDDAAARRPPVRRKAAVEARRSSARGRDRSGRGSHGGLMKVIPRSARLHELSVRGSDHGVTMMALMPPLAGPASSRNPSQPDGLPKVIPPSARLRVLLARGTHVVAMAVMINPLPGPAYERIPTASQTDSLPQATAAVGPGKVEGAKAAAVAWPSERDQGCRRA